jgi:hypothetical protein
VGIVFFGDLCFMLAVPLWMLSITSKVAIDEFHSRMGAVPGGQAHGEYLWAEV